MKLLGWVLFAASLGLMGGMAIAQDPADRFVGAFYSHDTLAHYKMAITVDATGKDKAPRNVLEQRERFVVPEFYGNLFDITQNQDRAVLWYADEKGVIRNVVLDKADFILMEIERQDVDDLRYEIVR